MTELDFRKSVRCDTGSCVEVSIGDEVQMRNSNVPGQTVAFSKEDWKAFVAQVREGKFEVE